MNHPIIKEYQTTVKLKVKSEEPKDSRWTVIPSFFLQPCPRSSLKSKYMMLVFERAADSHLIKSSNVS